MRVGRKHQKPNSKTRKIVRETTVETIQNMLRIRKDMLLIHVTHTHTGNESDERISPEKIHREEYETKMQTKWIKELTFY